MSQTPELNVRPYTPSDREAIRQICCETGYSGDPIDPVFSDRDVFADFFTRYYTDCEPESSFVAEDNGRIIGYILGCRRYHYHAIMGPVLLLLFVTPKVIWRLLTGQYNNPSRKFLIWCCLKGTKETPAAPGQSAHFHFNILPEYRNSGVGRQLLIKNFFPLCLKGNVKRVYGQIQTFDDRRPLRAFERYGFKEMDRKEMTKFKDFQEKKVYCSTFVKDLSE